MKTEELEQTETWAMKTFGAAELGDSRRADRLVKIAMALAENPVEVSPGSSKKYTVRIFELVDVYTAANVQA
jgi:hypothetical protein